MLSNMPKATQLLRAELFDCRVACSPPIAAAFKHQETFHLRKNAHLIGMFCLMTPKACDVITILSRTRLQILSKVKSLAQECKATLAELDIS